MNGLVFHVLAVLAGAGAPTAPENELLNELVTKGVVMPDGQIVRLPVPTMGEGLNEQQQAAVLTAIAPRGNVEEFLDKATNPVVLKLGKKPSATGDDVIRTVNASFVVYGDWNVLTSDEFSKGILKEGKTKNGKTEGMVSKAGYLKVPELTVRRLSTRSMPDLKEYYLYTTFKLFERVEVSATRFGVATRTPSGVIVAAKICPRFAKDKEYPNQWRAIDRNAVGDIVLGPLQPYSGAGFYAKVTRLIKPDDAIFVEFHEVCYEPRGWFGEDDNRLPSELRKIIPFEVKTFRAKLAKATLEQAEKKADEQPAEK
jgi:hypothetical protein